MVTSDCATDTGLADSQIEAQRPPDGASKPLKGLFLGFAATVTLGLALAIWYVGVRIVAANEAVPSSTPIASSTTSGTPGNSPVPSPAQSNVQKTASAPTPAAVPPAVAAPPPPDFYLQVEALGPKQDVRFVKSLQAKGLRAKILTGEKLDDARILIGPFSARAAMEKAQRKLQSAGVLAVEAAN
jgi:cell division septation protein DedD